jgi:glucose-6-phosphate-specific signal transduction histidine kinase
MEQTTVQTTQPEATQPSMPTSALMTTLMALVENYIKDIVSAQVNEILMSHRTLRVIDDGFEKKIRDIAKEVALEEISDHCDGEYHISESDIDDTVSTAINDFDFDDKINEAVNDAINDFDFEDIVRTAIKDSVTFTVTVD